MDLGCERPGRGFSPQKAGVLLGQAWRGGSRACWTGRTVFDDLEYLAELPNAWRLHQGTPGSRYHFEELAGVEGC